MIEWQLNNPEATKEACQEWLIGEMTAGRLPQVGAKPEGQRKGTTRNEASGKRATGSEAGVGSGEDGLDEGDNDGMKRTKKPKTKQPK